MPEHPLTDSLLPRAVPEHAHRVEPSETEEAESQSRRAVEIDHLNAQMEPSLRLPRRSVLREWSWLFVTLLGLTAFVLALVGHDDEPLRLTSGPWGSRFLDALALFPSGFPSAGSRALHPRLAFQIAMYLAPIVALWVTGSVIFAIYARRWSEHRARSRDGHAVVCGLGEKGLRSARALLARGDEVTCIELDAMTDAADDIRARGGRIVEGDATQLTTLRRAAAGRASMVVCACASDSANAQVASHVEQLSKHRALSPVDVHVHIANAELSGILRSPTFGVENVRLHFYSAYELWGRSLADEARLGEAAHASAAAPRIVVVGDTSLARSLIMWLALRWFHVAPGSDRLRITVVADEASSVCAGLEQRYPSLNCAAELAPVDHSLSKAGQADLTALAASLPGNPAAAIYFCLADDAENLSMALLADKSLPPETLIVVPAAARTARLARLLLRVREKVRVVDYADDRSWLAMIEDSRRELMAHEVHNAFLAGGLASGRSNVPWASLPPDLQDSNRFQVDALDEHLRALWYEIDVQFDWNAPLAKFSDTEIETLAELEHLRWCEEKRQAGFEFGPRREAKMHPDLLPWASLGEEARSKDRNAVRAWPAILARAGYGLVRSRYRQQLAERIHERHRVDREAAGDSATQNVSLRPWQELDREHRERNLSSADDIALKIARLGLMIIPESPDTAPYRFSDEQVEAMAEWEHERWRKEREAGGWRHGQRRDEAAKIHPDVVPWPLLPDDRRRIDRDHVRAIPGLLSAVGLAIAAR